MTDVAVVIPVYKEHKYLHRAIASVCNQTFPVTEICVVDDGSNDPEILRIVETFNQPRIRLLSLPENRGLSAARNLGVKTTKSPLIAFIDADDYWASDKIQKQIDLYKKNHATIIASSLVFHEESQLPKPLPIVIPAQPLQKLFKELFFVSPSSLFLSRETFNVLEGFDEKIRFGEDWDFLVRAAMNNEKFGSVESPTHMQVHAKSFSVTYYPKNDIRRIRKKCLQLARQDKRITPLMVALSLSAMARWMHGKHNQWFEFYLLAFAFITSPKVLFCEQYRGNIVHFFMNRKAYAR